MQAQLIFTCSLTLSLVSVHVIAFTIRPKPVPGSPAEPCDPVMCKLPDCFCSGTTIPGGLPAKYVPQIVMITFDDAVNYINFKLYTELFNDKTNPRKNPNGCDITPTYFVSHEWTNYPDIAKLDHRRHELADHSITHRTPTTWWKNASYTEWMNEIGGQREILHKFGNVKEANVKGFRAPYLQVGGNKQFKALYDLGFLYDSSMETPEVEMWPYTLDYKSTQACVIGPCPTDSFPGLWVVPMVDSKDSKKQPCSMMDDCPNQPQNENEAYKFFMDNFIDHYHTNRSPFPMFMHAAWFVRSPYVYKALIKFIDQILTMKDVYILSVSQAIEWVKNPTPLYAIKSFKPWMCDVPPPPLTCDADVCCYDNEKNNVPCNDEGNNWITHYFRTCNQPCTQHYPWYGNPDGN